LIEVRTDSRHVDVCDVSHSRQDVEEEPYKIATDSEIGVLAEEDFGTSHWQIARIPSVRDGNLHR